MKTGYDPRYNIPKNIWSLYEPKTDYGEEILYFSPKAMFETIFLGCNEYGEDIDERIKSMCLLGIAEPYNNLWWMYAQGMTLKEFYSEGFDGESFFFVPKEVYKAYSLRELIEMFDLDLEIKKAVIADSLDDAVYPKAKKVAEQDILRIVERFEIDGEEYKKLINSLDLLGILYYILRENQVLMYAKTVDQYKIEYIEQDEIPTSRPGPCRFGEHFGQCPHHNCNRCSIYYFLKGSEKYWQDGPDDCLPLFEKATSLNPDFDEPYFYIASIFDDLGQNEKTEEYLALGFKRNPFHPLGWSLRMLAHIKDFDLDDVDQYLNEVEKGVNYRGQTHLAWLIRKQKKAYMTNLTEQINALIEKYPTNPELNVVALINAYNILHDYNLAYEYCCKIIEHKDVVRPTTLKIALDFLPELIIRTQDKQRIVEIYDDLFDRTNLVELISWKYQTIKELELPY